VRNYFIPQSSDSEIKIKTSYDQLDSYIAKWFRDSVGRGEDGKKRRAISSDAKKTKNQTDSENLDIHDNSDPIDRGETE